MGKEYRAQWVRVRFYTYHDPAGHYVVLAWASFAGVILRSVLVYRQVVYFGKEWIWFSLPLGEA